MMLICLGSVFGLDFAPRYPGDSFGNNQYYDVVFDEEGEASVAARIDLSNFKKEDLSFFVVEIPGRVRMINSVAGYMVKEERCVEYESGKCVKWESYWGYREKYYTLDYKSNVIGDSVRYVFTLPKNVGEQESVKILLYYKVMGYVKEDLGVYNFEFKSIREEYDVDMVRVAVNVVDDLILDGGEGKTNYNYNYLTDFKSQDVESSELRGFSDSITWASGYVKETSGLDPWENFSVTGKYSGSWFLLNLKKILGGLFVVGLVLLGLGFFIKKMKVKDVSWKIVLSSFGSGVGIIGVWYLLFLIMDNLRYVNYQFQQFFMMLMLMVAGLVMFVLLFGPSVYFGVKYKKLSLGVWCFVGTVIWLVVIGVVLFSLFGMSSSSPVYRGVMETALEVI